MEVDSLKKENHCYGGGQFKGGRMVVTEVVILIKPSKQSTLADVSLTSVQRQFNVSSTLN